MQLFTGLVGIFVLFVDLTESLPVGTKPVVTSELASGFLNFTQNNKVLYKNKIVPKLMETAKVSSVNRKTRRVGSNPYYQTFQLISEKTVVEPLVKPTDYQLKSVGDEKSTQLSTKKLEAVEKITELTPKKPVDDKKIIKPTQNKLEEKETNKVSSKNEVDDGETISWDQVSPKTKLCGNSSETSSYEEESSEETSEESSEESTTDNQLSQCNSSEEEGSGDSLSEGSGNQSSEENEGESFSGSGEGITTELFYGSGGDKLVDNYLEGNEEEAKENKSYSTNSILISSDGKITQTSICRV